MAKVRPCLACFLVAVLEAAPAPACRGVGEPPAGEPVVVEDVEVRQGVTIGVIDGEGRPVDGALVLVEEEGREIVVLTADEFGKAVVVLDPAAHGRLRVAATSGNAWGLYAWCTRESVRRGMSVALLPAGILAVESEGPDGVLRLETRGWDLAGLLAKLGARPEVYSGTPLLIPGLPEGDYTATLAGESHPVTVRADATVRVVFAGPPPK
jgi:hypothetical protein